MPKTVENFLEELAERDLTLKEWARQGGHNLNTVYAVISSRAQGKRGETRRVMKAMGLPVPRLGSAGIRPIAVAKKKRSDDKPR